MVFIPDVVLTKRSPSFIIIIVSMFHHTSHFEVSQLPFTAVVFSHRARRRQVALLYG
jgi:hypothetical protein